MSRKSRSSSLAGTGLPVLDTLPSTDDDASLAARTLLAARLSILIEARTRDAGMLAAMPAVVPRTLTLIRRYRLRRLSLDHLIRALVALDQHVEIVVRAADGDARVGIVAGWRPTPKLDKWAKLATLLERSAIAWHKGKRPLSRPSPPLPPPDRIFGRCDALISKEAPASTYCRMGSYQRLHESTMEPKMTKPLLLRQKRLSRMFGAGVGLKHLPQSHAR